MTQGALQHAAGQFQFAGKRNLIGNAGTLTALTAFDPGLGHVQARFS